MHDSLTPKKFGNVLVKTYFLINYHHYDHTCECYSKYNFNTGAVKFIMNVNGKRFIL